MLLRYFLVQQTASEPRLLLGMVEALPVNTPAANVWKETACLVRPSRDIEPMP